MPAERDVRKARRSRRRRERRSSPSPPKHSPPPNPSSKSSPSRPHPRAEPPRRAVREKARKKRKRADEADLVSEKTQQAVHLPAQRRSAAAGPPVRADGTVVRATGKRLRATGKMVAYTEEQRPVVQALMDARALHDPNGALLADPNISSLFKLDMADEGAAVRYTVPQRKRLVSQRGVGESHSLGPPTHRQYANEDGQASVPRCALRSRLRPSSRSAPRPRAAGGELDVQKTTANRDAPHRHVRAASCGRCTSTHFRWLSTSRDDPSAAKTRSPPPSKVPRARQYELPRLPRSWCGSVCTLRLSCTG